MAEMSTSGANIFPVPILRDATSFDIGHVILKSRRSRMEKMTGVLSSALPVGQLSKFVTGDTNTLMERIGSGKKDTESAMNQAYEFHESDMKNGVKKTVTVQLWGCEKWAMEYVPNSGDLTLDMQNKGFTNIDRVFLITEVYYVTGVKVNVTIGDREDDYLIKGRIPIGFALVRYNLLANGALGSSKKVKKSSWRARWIRKSFRDEDDQLPFDPFQAGSSVSGTAV